MSISAKDRQVVILVHPQVELLDVAGPANVLSTASRLSPGSSGYRVRLYAAAAGPVPTAAGVDVVARGWSHLRGPIDTLVVPGTVQIGHADAQALVPVIRRLAPRARRVVGVCTGALLLADAGLLAGRRAVTHWAACGELQRRDPTCLVEPDPIFIHDENIWTSAGITAGMDLALALVEEDFNADRALQVARWQVMYLRRPGGQSQFTPPEPAKGAPHGMQALVQWIGEHLEQRLTVPALARHAAMSPRNFARAFRRHTGRTPAAWVSQARLQAARTLLERTTDSVASIAAATGQSPESLHRRFVRELGSTPRQYRTRFTGGC
ncbi:MAG: GlxA family transcriptional regulator [Nannocystales bacterium]